MYCLSPSVCLPDVNYFCIPLFFHVTLWASACVWASSSQFLLLSPSFECQIGRASKRYTGGQLLTQTKIAGHFPIRSSPLLLIFLSHHLYLCTHHHSSSSYHRVGLFRQPPTKPSSPVSDVLFFSGRKVHFLLFFLIGLQINSPHSSNHRLRNVKKICHYFSVSYIFFLKPFFAVAQN